MRREFQGFFLLKVLGILLILGTAVHFLHAFQMNRQASELLRMADTAADKGDLEHAVTYYRSYLANQPEDVDTLVKLAVLLDDHAFTTDEGSRAAAVLEEVVKKDPDRHDIHERMIRRLISQLQIRDAIVQLERLIPHVDNKAELEHMLGWCQEATGQYEKALDSFAQAIQDNPQSLSSYALAAEVWQNRLHNDEEAGQMLDEMVVNNAESVEAYLIRSRYRVSREEMAAAEADLDTAWGMDPDSEGVLLAKADWSLRQNDHANARTWLEKGHAKSPRNELIVKALVNLDLQQGRRGDAINNLRQAILDMPLAWDLSAQLADLLIDAGQLDEARKQAVALRPKQGATPLADYLDGRLAYAQGHWSEVCLH